MPDGDTVRRFASIVVALVTRCMIAVTRTIFRIEVVGSFPEQGCVAVSLHDSYWDGILVGILHERLFPVTTSNMRRVRIVGWYLDRYGVIWTGRSVVATGRRVTIEISSPIASVPGEDGAALTARYLKVLSDSRWPTSWPPPHTRTTTPAARSPGHPRWDATAACARCPVPPVRSRAAARPARPGFAAPLAAPPRRTARPSSSLEDKLPELLREVAVRADELRLRREAKARAEALYQLAIEREEEQARLRAAEAHRKKVLEQQLAGMARRRGTAGLRRSCVATDHRGYCRSCRGRTRR